MKAKLFLFTLLISSVSLLNACTVAKGDTLVEPALKVVQVQKLEKTSLTKNISLTGTIEGQNQTVLSAKAPGRIEAVNYDIGDTVKQGAVLVQLVADETGVSLKSAQSAHSNLLSSLQNTKILMDTQINSAAKNIETLKIRLQALENTRKSTDEITARQVALATDQVALTETRLANVDRSLDQNQADVSSQKIRLVTQATILSHGILDQLYGLLNMSAGNLNHETTLDKRFGQASFQSRTDTLNTLKKLRDSVGSLRKYYDEVIKTGSASDQDIEKGFSLAKGALEETKTSLEVVHNLLLNTVAHSALPQEQLDSLRAKVTGLGQQTEALLLSVSGGQAVGFDGLSQVEAGIGVERQNQQAEFASQLAIAGQQLSLAQETRNQQLSAIDDNLLILKSQIAEAENARLTAVASRDMQVQLLKTQADQALGQLSMAQVAYRNTLIKAPADGVIMSKMAEVGTVVSPGMPLMEFADPRLAKIRTDVAEEDADALKVGMTADFTVDSLPDKIFKARISRIGAHADSVTRKVPVEFEILNHDPALKIGAYARLELNLQPATDVLLLPNEALLRSGEREFVFVLQDGAAYEVALKTGRRHPEGIEVLSGVYAGNQVIISGLENLKSGDPVQILSITHD